jgi:hypothetical protein
MRYDHYSSDCRPRKPIVHRIIITATALIAVLALYGWMGSRDSEPQLAVLTYDCAPAMDMDMPIDVGRAQL